MDNRGLQDDRDLVRRFRSGDETAFAALFDRLEEALTARIRQRLGARIRRRVAVQDVLQEVRIVAHRRCAEFTGMELDELRRWLGGIADNKVRKALHFHGDAARRAVGREVSRGARPDTGHFLGRRTTPSQHAVATETRDLARRAMAKLPADYREVLRLVRFERLGFAEAAERMGRSYEALHKLHGRALLKFTELFDQLTRDDDDRS